MKKKAITVWAFENGVSGDYDIGAILKKLKVGGFDALELSFSEHGTISFDTDIDQLKRDYEGWRDEGIEFSSISTVLFEQINIASDDNGEREYAVAITRKMIDIASELQIETVSISPGKLLAGDSYKRQMSRVLESIKECGDYAKAKNLYLCIENIWGATLVSQNDFLTFLDNVNNDHVKMCLDIGNTLLTGAPNHWFEVLGDRVKKIHYTDIKNRKGIVREFVIPGTGNVDWKTLKQYDYFQNNKYCTVEFFNDKIKDLDGWLLECAKELDLIELR